MKLLSIILLAVTTLSFFGCSKWKKDKKDSSYYYSKDYKLSQGEILGVDIEEIDMLYTVFFYEGKNLKYKLVAEKKVNDSNKNEVLSYEYGSVEVDKNYTLQDYSEQNYHRRSHLLLLLKLGGFFRCFC